MKKDKKGKMKVKDELENIRYCVYKCRYYVNRSYMDIDHFGGDPTYCQMSNVLYSPDCKIFKNRNKKKEL